MVGSCDELVYSGDVSFHRSLSLPSLVQKRRLPHANLLSFHMLFLTIPFVMNTSWPVDLAYLPFAQSLVAWRVLQRPELPGASNTGISPGANGSPSRTARARKAVTILLLLLSITVSNVVFFNMVGDRVRYGFLGFQFWANLLLLAATYVLLIPSLQERKTSETASYNSLKLTRQASRSAVLESPSPRL
jgi:hypothetical protein